MQDKNAPSDAPNHRGARQRKLLTALIGSTALAAASTWLAFALWHSIAQRTLTMAGYPEGTLNAELANRYREILARHGVELKAAPSVKEGSLLASLASADAGGTGDLASVVGSFDSLGLSPAMVVKFVPIIQKYLKSKGASGIAEMLAGILK